MEKLRHVKTEFLSIREGETAVRGEHVYRRVGDFDCLSYHWRLKKGSAPQSWVTFKFSRKIRPSVVRVYLKESVQCYIYCNVQQMGYTITTRYTAFLNCHKCVKCTDSVRYQ